MENMRKTKLLPRKRKLIPKSIIKTARLVRESLEEQDKYLRKRRMIEKKSKLSRVSLRDKSAYLHRILIEKMLEDAKKILGL